MPRDSNGIYTLPNGYLAVAGQTIQPSQHNPPLEDVATALTNSLPRDGTAPMTAPVKLADGTASAPSLAFNSTAGVGLFKSTNGIGVAVGGVQVAEFGAAGFLGVIPIGGLVPYLGDTAPASWLFPIGQNISRTTYASLFTVYGTKYGAGDGSTTFGLPDLRGRSLFGKDDMGGTAANRIQVSTTITTTNASATATVASAAGLAVGMTVTSANVPAAVTITAINGTTLTLSTGTGVTAGSAIAARFSALGDAQALGSAGGAQTKTQSIAEMPNHNHTGGTGTASPTLPTYLYDNSTSGFQGGVSGTVGIRPSSSIQTSGDLTHAHTIPAQGGGLPISILPPGIICNYIIFAGA